MVITGLALGASSHLVYLCALMPAEGESAIELGSRYPGGLAALVDTDGAGDLVLRGDQLDEILWPDAPPRDRGEGPNDAAPPGDAVFSRSPPTGRVAAHTLHIRRRPLRPGLPPPARRRDGVEGLDRHRVGDSHSALLSRPDLVVDLLARIDAD
jgi:hypothetical protein